MDKFLKERMQAAVAAAADDNVKPNSIEKKKPKKRTENATIAVPFFR